MDDRRSVHLSGIAHVLFAVVRVSYGSLVVWWVPFRAGC